MSFRRLPFQFSTTDPVERQRELEKRFGVPSQNNMYVDAANPFTMGSGLNTSTSSPRFQHRVPMFVDGVPAKSSIDSMGCENKTPKVRVIPIEIEGDENVPSSRHRTFSGPAGVTKQHKKEVYPEKDDASSLKRSMEDLSKPSKMKAASGPKVYNIPIKVEQSGAKEKKAKADKGKFPTVKPQPKVNSCNVSKPVQRVEPEPAPKEPEPTEDRMKLNIENSMKKIESVREELKSYETGVNEFNGTAKDKQYRYLDEMLTRLMIKLDDIETMGNEEVRSSRKKVVKMVQACIDLLESKVNVADNPETSSNTNNAALIETVGQEDNAEQSAVVGENETEMNDKCEVKCNLGENQLEATLDSSKSTDKESSNAVEVPEVEMAEVTSTSSNINKNESVGNIGNLVEDQSKLDTANTLPDEKSTEPSESNEVEMEEAKTDNNDLQDQENMPKVEVSSTNSPQKDSVDSTQTIDSYEAEMTDVSSTLEHSSAVQKDEAVPEITSSNIQPESTVSSTEQFPTSTGYTEHSKIAKTVESVVADNNCSDSDVNLQSSIPEVEMKDIDENSCKTNDTNLVGEQSYLQSKCISSNELN